MPKHIFLEEVSTLLWFPDDPQFGQWMSKNSMFAYGLNYEYGGYSEINNLWIKNILVNWSNKKDVLAFSLHQTETPALSFYTSDTFKYLRERMDGVCMKAGHLMIERPTDVVMFRILYGEDR